MLRRLGRTAVVQGVLGACAVAWLSLVRATTRFERDPPDFGGVLEGNEPIIAAMWHGQHFMVPFAIPAGMRAGALVSRSADGELNARVLRRLGVEPIRGSGGSPRKARKRGGAVALREMTRKLQDGWTVAMTADIPKSARRCGDGIVLLAQISGRPVYPIAVVCRWRIDFASWDRASMGLPFGRGAMVLGRPVRVPRHATAQEFEQCRREVERSLDDAHARAYEMVGCRDPGAALRPTPSVR